MELNDNQVKIENLKKAIAAKETELKKAWDELKTIKEDPVRKITQQLQGIKRTTGQHPGGLLITLPGTDILEYTPLNYPADNRQAEWPTTHFEYSFLSDIFLKVDILGHDEPTVLQKLFEATNIDPMKIPFKDEKVMQMFTDADTLGIPEFGTDFVRKNLLTPLKPTKFSQLVQISGFSHGTDVWLQNQQTIYKNKKLSLNQLIACREDIWKFLTSWGVDNKTAFVATEFIRKGKWEKLSEEIKAEIKNKLSDKEGEIYFSILSKIKYIFPKPHAIAYTMTAWRSAYYKCHAPQAFYSVLLTHHATIYDIWLMSLNPQAVSFRLNNLWDNLANYKNSQKDLFSIIKVLEEAVKEKKKVEKKITEPKVLAKLATMDWEQPLNEIKAKINESEDKSLRLELAKSSRGWKMTAKEKGLLFTLKVILEMETRDLGFARGVDFNESEVKNFKIENNTIFFPFTAVSGVGEKVADKIVNYRQEKGRINDWKEELKEVINTGQLEQFKNLEQFNLILN